MIILLPNIINSQQIEIPSNRIITTANLGFVTQDQQYSIAILNNRIDVNYNKTVDSDVDIETFYAFSAKALVAIMDYFGIVSNRLAVNIQRVCEFDSFEKMHLCGKNLVTSAAYYDDKEFSEWSMRTNSQVDIELDERQEVLNVITDISSGQDITGQKAACLFHIDINTAPQIRVCVSEKIRCHPLFKTQTAQRDLGKRHPLHADRRLLLS